MDVLIVHYNTQELTEAAIRSLWRQTPKARVTLFDNSDRTPFRAPKDFDSKRITVIDNTEGQVIDFRQWLGQFPDRLDTTANDWGSAKHCYTVETCLDRFPKGFVLMDSDVLIRQDITPIIDKSKAFVGEVTEATRLYPVPRVLPMLCWINTPVLKKYGVHYFNAGKMWKLISREPECYYDTGAWLLEAVKNACLPYGTIRLDDYLYHYGSGSWHSAKKNPLMWLEKYSDLWQAQPTTARIYVCTHTDFEQVVKNPVYEVVDARQWNDDVCENGLRGSFYSELITYKHLAERDDLPDIVGFCHYRKYYSFLDDVPDLPALFRDYECVAAEPTKIWPNVRLQYGGCHNVKDLDIVTAIVKRDYPELWDWWCDSLFQPKLYACNMFIVRRRDFLWIVKTVFEILDKYLEEVGLDIEGRIAAHPEDYHIGMKNSGKEAYQYRIGGYLGERIVNALLRYRFRFIKTYPMIITGKTLNKY